MINNVSLYFICTIKHIKLHHAKELIIQDFIDDDT
jgi:hypothetical protein